MKEDSENWYYNLAYKGLSRKYDPVHKNILLGCILCVLALTNKPKYIHVYQLLNIVNNLITLSLKFVKVSVILGTIKKKIS